MTNGTKQSERQEDVAISNSPKHRTPRKAHNLVEFFRAKAASVVSFGDSLVASRVGKYFPAFVFATSVITTAQLWKVEQDGAVRDFAANVEVRTSDIEHSVNQKIQGYVQILQGARAFFDASDFVSPEEFRQYASSLKLAEKHPEIRGISVSYYVPGDELSDHVADMRKR